MQLAQFEFQTFGTSRPEVETGSRVFIETCPDDVMKSYGLEAICLSCNSELKKCLESFCEGLSYNKLLYAQVDILVV